MVFLLEEKLSPNLFAPFCGALKLVMKALIMLEQVLNFKINVNINKTLIWEVI